MSFRSPEARPDVASPPSAPRRAHRLEQLEAEAWSDIYSAASFGDVHRLGLRLVQGAHGTLLASARTDVLALNRVVGFGIDGPPDAELLDAMVSTYRAAGARRFFVQVSPFSAPAAIDRLEAHGFRHYNNWAKLFRSVEPPPPVTSDLRVERIGRDGAEAFATIITRCFDWPAPARDWIGRTVGRTGWSHYAALDGDVPVAIAAMFTARGYAYFGPAATLQDHRGRGAQSALIARRIRDAESLGCVLLVTETAEDRPERPSPSFRNLTRAGFQLAYLRPNYLYTFGDAVG
jgi:GNAT superfamily N-acetyltransferase